MPERHFWDACCWIDFVQEGGDATKPMTALWNVVVAGAVELVISPVILCETLMRLEGAPRPWPDPHPADAMFDAHGVVLAQLDRRVGVRARSLRRAHKLAAPDALHLACCLEHNVELMITRDKDDLLKLSPMARPDGGELRIVSPAEALSGPLFELTAS